MTLCPRCNAQCIPAEGGTEHFCRTCWQTIGDPAQMPRGGAEAAVRGSSEAQGAVSAAITMHLPYPPSTNNLFATVDGRRVKTAAARAYCEEAGTLARRVFPEMLTGRLSVAIVVYPKRGIGMDLDNAVKSCLDALTGVAWRDDSQVWQLYVERGAAVKGGALDVLVKEYQP